MNIDLMELEMYALKYQNRFGYDEPFFINLIDRKTWRRYQRKT
jgi:hypothetical protein